MLNFDQVGSRNLDKLPSNSVNWVIAILIDWVNSVQFESFYSILVPCCST